MEPVRIEVLNREHGIAGRVHFAEFHAGLPVAQVHSGEANATVALHGAQVLDFGRLGEPPLVWLSAHSEFKAGKAIRGGIPVCWPWFANHPTDASKPPHGVVRTAAWDVLATEVLANNGVALRLGIAATDASRQLWPHDFALELSVTVAETLQVELTVRNRDQQPFTFAGALHSYFGVSDIAAIRIDGLARSTYVDKVDGFQHKVQDGALRIDAETDRIYLDTVADCVIEDPGLRRRIRIAKAGSRTTVVWNPWRDKAMKMSDFGDDEYTKMVCVETANAENDTITLAPSAEHRLSTIISREPL